MGSSYLQPPPLMPEEITPAWLSSILNEQVTSVEITRVIPGTATKVFISVTYASPNPSSPTHGALPSSFCVKGGLDPAMLKAIPFLHTLYDREVAFYSHVAPSLLQVGTIDFPKCYHADQGLLVLEDLTASTTTGPSNITFGTPLKPFSIQRILSGVEQLAALHAQTWNMSPPEWLLGQEGHYENAILHLMNNYEAAVRGADRPPIPEYLKVQTRMGAVLTKHFDLAAQQPRYTSLVHGDAHVSNTYLVGGTGVGEKPDVGQTRFLDWQMIHIASPFRDLAYFLVGALDVQTRREKEWEVVAYYLRMLEKSGGPRLYLGDNDQDDRDGVREEYKRAMLAGVGPIVCPYEMQPREWVFAMAERYAAAIDDHKVLEFVEGL
ncbi:aminoglycoside phosphotransferase [Naviculisporaceae sp. PSN 640]